MKKYVKKICLILLSLMLSFQVIEFRQTKVAAAEINYDSWIEISTSPNQTLNNADYKVTKNTTITASSTQNGIKIQGDVSLYIPSGVTLTVKGGAGNGMTGGGAGIYLPTGAILRVYGEGKIDVTGGKAGAPTQGGKASTSPSLSGAGGNGGGGAGAGVGGNGGNGGRGGSSTGPTTGNKGANGSVGASGGSLYLYDTVTIYASVGDYDLTKLSQTADYIRNGSGGNGGYGGQGAAFGAGGSGGGGGGSGSIFVAPYNRGSGGGGGGGSSETLGGMNGHGQSSNNPSRGLLGGSGVQTTGSSHYSGAGGNSVQGANGGKVYKASTATINLNGSTNPAMGDGGVATTIEMSTITLNHMDGTSTLSSITGINGEALPDISQLPTRTGYTFTGYWSNDDGTGTKYINEDGTSTGNKWDSNHTTIYAGWQGIKYTLTIDKDGISDFTVNGAIHLSDNKYTMTYGTKVTLEATPEEGKAFIGWYGNDTAYDSALNPYTFLPPAKDITFTGTAVKGVWVEDTLEFDPSDFSQETFYSTATIKVNLDGSPKDMGSVTLRNGTDIINASGTNGEYTYTNILDTNGKEYNVFVGGEDTGKTVKFDNQTGSSTTVNYYSTTIHTTLDGNPYNPGKIEFSNLANTNDKISVFYDSDLKYTYYYRLEDTNSPTYSVLINGEDTGERIDFKDTHVINIGYHTAKVETKLDGHLSDMGTITLHNQNGIKYTLSGNGGSYQTIKRDSDTYDIYLNGIDTNKDVTFDNTTVEINYFTVSYKLGNHGATGTVPAPQVYQEGKVIEVAGVGNITLADHHFAGWSDGQDVYPVNSNYTVTKTTEFTDEWEADGASQAKWRFGNEKIWHFGTLADAVAVTKRTTTSLEVVIQASGTMPNDTDMTIRNNQSWELNPSVAVNILENSKVTNQGTFTNNGTLSGDGELINSGHFDNAKGTVKVVKIDNTNGLLYGGTYGEINGEKFVKVEITGGEVKAVDANTKVILGDYSTMKDVTVPDKETVISVMGKTTVKGVPTPEQLRDNFGGLAIYDDVTKTIKLTCNLYFRDTINFEDIVLDPDDNTHEGIDIPKVFAGIFELTSKGEYIENIGGTVSIQYLNSINGPDINAEMLVPSGANLILNATADGINGYEFVGWYTGIENDPQGKMIGLDTLISNKPKSTVADVKSDIEYYAVFKKVQYALNVSTDPATTAEVVISNVENPVAELGNSEETDITIDFGDKIIVNPLLKPAEDDTLKDRYSFLGFMKNYDDGRTEQVIEKDVTTGKPAPVPYIASAEQRFDYSLATLTMIQGMLTYNMNGGTLPGGGTQKIENIDLLTSQENKFTLSTVVPVKQGWVFEAWERQDDSSNTRYQPGGNITLTGVEKDAGVLLVAVYKRDSATQYYVKSNANPDEEIGFKSLNDAVAATKDSTSDVYGKKQIFFNAGDSVPQVGEVYGTLPNGYTLTSIKGAKLTISQGKTLQIGDETASNSNNNKDKSWKKGAHVENIEFINNQGTVKFDGQQSWIDKGGFTLYPNSKVHLLSDLNTGNILNITLWDSANSLADIANSGHWKEDSVIVTSDDNDGDISTVDGNDTHFNLMSGRVRIVNDGYSVYNDLTASADTGGYSLKVFNSNKVKAMRTPLSDDTLDYADPLFIIEYRTIQEAIDDASRSNVGGNGEPEKNTIWIVGDSDEDFVIKGDDPDKNGAIFVDYGDNTYSAEVSFLSGARTKNGASLEVNVNATVYDLSGEIGLTGVDIASNKKGTIFNLNNFKLSGQVTVEENSYIQVTNSKIWGQDEKITMIPDRNVEGRVIHKQVLAKDDTDTLEHFTLPQTMLNSGYALRYDANDTTIRVVYLGDAIQIIEDLDDIKTIVGEDAVFTTKVSYPTKIEGVEITPEKQGFKYTWYQKLESGNWTEITDLTHIKVVYENGVATLTYSIPNVDITSNKTQFKCEVYNDRGVSTGVKPVTREARLVVENVTTVFIQIPQEVILRETEPDMATNVEKDDADERNMISLKTFKNESNYIDGNIGNAETPSGTYTIKTEQTLDLTLDGLPQTDPSKMYKAWVLKSDYHTLLPDDKILMKLQKGGNEKERFYLRMPLRERKPLGVYKTNMTFVIEYSRKP